MKKETNLTLGVSESEKVDEYMNSLKHPLLPIVHYLREYITNVNKKIGEGIYWNAPVFFYTGSMKPFNPKEYKRYIVGFNFFKQDCIRMIFLQGELASDPTGLLEGDYKDGRRLVQFKSMEEVKSKEKELKKIILQLVKLKN